jgi:hypothetical protein
MNLGVVSSVARCGGGESSEGVVEADESEVRELLASGRGHTQTHMAAMLAHAVGK